MSALTSGRLIAEASPRALVGLLVLLAVLIVAPVFASGYLVAVLIVILSLAYTGQAWNIMLGFAGQLSLGHALYFGLGAYIAAAGYVKFGLSPWLGMIVGAIASAVASSGSPWLTRANCVVRSADGSTPGGE